MNLLEVDFNKNWLAVNSHGKLWVAPKDLPIIRWLKYLVQLLTCGCIRCFDHIRIDRVAQAIFSQYNNASDAEKKHWRIVVDSLLLCKGPIRTYRKVLMDLESAIAEENT